MTPSDPLRAETIALLESIINKACHPDIALRIVMLELAPIRAHLAKLKAAPL